MRTFFAIASLYLTLAETLSPFGSVVPTTRYLVAFVTVLDTEPPQDFTKWLASSRDRFTRSPENAKDLPSRHPEHGGGAFPALVVAIGVMSTSSSCSSYKDARIHIHTVG